MAKRRIRCALLLLCVFTLLCAMYLHHHNTPAKTLTGTARAGLVLTQEEEAYYVLAVIDRSRADRAGICAGDTILQIDGEMPETLLDADAFFSSQQADCSILLRRDDQELSILLPAP